MSELTTEGTSAGSSRLLATSATALMIEVGAQLLIGIVLSLGYTPTVGAAHSSTAAMHEGGLTHVLQGAHYWGSAVLILHSLAHLLTMTWTGGYRRPYGAQYIASILAFLSALGYQLTGNLLPFDRHGVQTAGIEASIGGRAPVLGQTVTKLILGGTEVGQPTLDRWYFAHRFLLPALSILAFAIALAAHRKLRGEPSADRRLVLAPTILAVVLGLVIQSPLGSAATPADYETFAARASWYMWPLHGTMRFFDSLSSGLGWIGALAIPGLFVLFLLTLPFLGEKVPTRVARGVVLAFALILFASTAIFGGAPAALIGTRDPVEAGTSGKPNAVSPVDKALAQRGKDFFNKNDCVNCHGKDGGEALGGPSLTRVWQRHPDAEYYIRYIAKPTSVNPSSTMPAFPKISQDDLKALAEFLREEKK